MRGGTYRTRTNVLPARKQMRPHGSQITQRRENRKRAHKRIKRPVRSDVDASQHSHTATAHKLCAQRVAPAGRDMAQPARSGCCVVTGESPEHAAADDVGAGDGDDEIEDENKEETYCACVAAGDLLVHCCEGEGDDVGVKDVVKGCDAVELGWNGQSLCRVAVAL